VCVCIYIYIHTYAYTCIVHIFIGKNQFLMSLLQCSVLGRPPERPPPPVRHPVNSRFDV